MSSGPDRRFAVFRAPAPVLVLIRLGAFACGPSDETGGASGSTGATGTAGNGMATGRGGRGGVASQIAPMSDTSSTASGKLQVYGLLP